MAPAAIFASSVQPPLLSLFSSTNSECLALFSTSTDQDLPADSFICLLHDTTSSPAPVEPAKLISIPLIGTDDEAKDGPENRPGYTLNQTVLHIQSPTLPTTYIRCPGRGHNLGLEHPWLHLQVRNLGKEWSFELGIVDTARRTGRIRCSTFQGQPELELLEQPLLHLPLSFPPAASHLLTAWSTINLHLPSLLPHFSSASLIRRPDSDSDDDDSNDREKAASSLSRVRVPSGRYSHLAYVKVYATCRLRRIWVSETGPEQKLPWEFELYGNWFG